MYPYFFSLSELERAVCHPLPDQGDRRAQPGGGRDGRQVYILHTVNKKKYISRAGHAATLPQQRDHVFRPKNG